MSSLNLDVVKDLTAEMREDMGQDWPEERRLEYLREQAAGTIVEWWQERLRMDDYTVRARVAEMILTRERLDTLISDLRRTLKEINRLMDDRPVREGDITPEMVERARAYPFTELHPFTRGMGLCPFHPDKTPSMSLKNTRARCWSCMDKSMDTIEFVMRRDGLSFPDAVRRLQ